MPSPNKNLAGVDPARLDSQLVDRSPTALGAHLDDYGDELQRLGCGGA